MSLWYEEHWQNAIRFSLRTEGIVVQAQSDFQRIEIFDTRAFGRVLALDGIYMTSEGDEFFYHEMIVHPALTAHAAPRNVLIIGGGDGGTAREVLRHPDVESATMVEIDEKVVEVCKVHLPRIGTAWDDPRLDLRIGDGIAHVQASPDDAYDVVILDGSDPVGPSAPLFNEAFYRDVRRILRPGGVFSLQSESPIITTDIWIATNKRLKSVFGRVDMCFGPVPLYSTGVWSWTCASDSVDATQPRADRVGPHLDACRYYSPAMHRGAFTMPPYAQALLDGK